MKTTNQIPKQSLRRRAGDIIVRGLVLLTYPIWGPVDAFIKSRRKNYHPGPPD